MKDFELVWKISSGLARTDEMIHKDLCWSFSVKLLKFFSLHANALDILDNTAHCHPTEVSYIHIYYNFH